FHAELVAQLRFAQGLLDHLVVLLRVHRRGKQEIAELHRCAYLVDAGACARLIGKMRICRTILSRYSSRSSPAALRNRVLPCRIWSAIAAAARAASRVAM